MNRPCLRLAATLALVLLSSAAGAAFRAYVSSSGSDANPCTLPAPCRLLPAALAAVDAGGEIWMLDSANYNTATVTIDKAVSVLAVPGAVGSVVATGGGDGLSVNAPVDAKVTLRNLVVVHLGSSQYGINYTAGARLEIVDCEIANMQLGGIRASAPGVLALTRTLLRGNHAAAGNSSGVYAIGTVTVVADEVQMRGNDYGIQVIDGARLTLTNSQIVKGVQGVWATADNAAVDVAIRNTVFTRLQGIGVFSRASFGNTLLVSIERSTFTDGAIGVTLFRSAPASTVIVMLSENTITNQNTTAINFQVGAGVAYTRGNNIIEFNVADFTGGTLTARAAH
jgi:hypothetical protein